MTANRAPQGRAAPIRHVARRRRPLLTAVKVLAATLAVVLVSTLGVAGFEAWRVGRELSDGAVDIGNGSKAAPVSIAAMRGAFNVLLVGADNAPGQKHFGEARDATLNDVNILVHIAADHRSGTVISFPRDLVIAHPQCTDPVTHAVYSAMSAQPLNTAFARGGLGCVVATVNNLTGIPIPYASLFSFQGTVAMADAVGGVPVCVTKAIDDPDSGLTLPAGRSIVKGRTALAYLRDRHGVGDGSDLARIASQQAYMSSLLRTMTARSTFTDPAKLYGLATAAGANVTLSKSLADPNTIVTMALALKKLNLNKMVFVQYPVGTDPADSNKVVPSTALAAELVDRVLRDRPVGLDDDSLGSNAALSGRSTDAHNAETVAAPTGKKHTADDTIPGLHGQTAGQRTCSVAND
ncbi:LCP family protein [uncultured Amnibacterium sp.]|uniref:LCP family protein n=1 Tax=uncultured Amnibacterium sp. TaxID=1631851 RepID=UPI0035CB62C6